MADTAAPRRAEVSGLVLGGGALQIAGVLTTILAPLLADGLGAAGLDNAAIGVHLTVLHVVQMITIFVLAGTGWLTHLDRRRSGVAGCLIGAAGLAWIATGPSQQGLLIAMAVVGLGAGAAYASGGSALSYAHNTERAYAIVTIASIVIGAVVLTGSAVVAGSDARVGVFVALAVVQVGLAVAALRLPAFPAVSRGAADGEPWLGGPGVALIAGYFLMNLGLLAIWTFSGQIGQAAGLSQDTSWWFLGVAQLLSIVGCLIAWAMGRRPAKVGVLVASVLGLALGKLMVGSTVLWAYVIGNLLTNLAFYTAIPFVFAAGADLNPRSGRLVVLVGVGAMAAGAIAPLLGGAVAGESGNWLRLGVVVAAILLLSLPLLLIAERAAWRRKSG